MHYREDLTAHEWRPSVPKEYEYVKNERQWLLLGNKIAFLHVYIACHNYTNDSYIKWNDDLFELICCESITLRTQGFCVLAMGDFNTRVGRLPGLEWNDDVVNPNFTKFNHFLHQVNLVIINTLPIAKGQFSRFMDSQNSKSLIDFGLIDGEHVSNVNSFIIDEDARYACGSDHALLECEVKLGTRPTINWNISEAIQYDIRENTNYDTFRDRLDSNIAQTSITTFKQSSLDEMLPHIVQSITRTAEDTIGKFVCQSLKFTQKLPIFKA